MKKIITVALTVAIALSCTACRNVKNGVQLVTSETAAERSASNKKDKTYKTPELNKEPVIEETVMVDECGVKIIATSLEYTEYSAELKLTIENNTDMNLEIVSGSLGYDCGAINGYVVNGLYMNADVAAGKKAAKSITISNDELMMYGIYEIAEIEIGFDIGDDEYNDILKTGPRKVKTTAADKYDYSANSFTKTMKNKDVMAAHGLTLDYMFENVYDFDSGISVLSEMLATNENGKKMFLFEFINNSSNDYIIASSNIHLNGLLIKEGTWESNIVTAGHRCVGTISLTDLTDDIDVEAFGLTTVSDMSFVLNTYDLDYDEMYTSDAVEVKFSNKSLSYSSSGTELYNNNGFRIISKGVIDDSAEYTDTVHILLLVENNSSKTVDFKTVLNSLSINGYMTDFFSSSTMLEPNEASAMKISVIGRSLSENGINNAADITDAEISLKIRDVDYKTIDEPVLKITY